MSSKLLFLVWILSILYALQSSVSALSPYKECNDVALKLSIDNNLCSGQSNQDYTAQIKHINDSRSLRQIGIQLRRLGYLDNAQVFLDRSLEISPNSDQTRLGIANLIQTRYRRSFRLIDLGTESIQNLDETDRAISLARKAMSEYQEILNSSVDRQTQIDASLNWLNLWSNLSVVKELKELRTQNLNEAIELANKVNSELFSESSSEGVEAELKLSEFLIRVINLNPNFQRTAREILINSLKKGHQLENLRIISKAEGLLGQLSELDGHKEEAIPALSMAYSHAEAIRAYDLAYKWSWDLGKLSVAKGDYKKGLSFYSEAVSRAEAVRSGMLSTDTELQYSFRDDIEPLYQEYLALLFNNPQLNFDKIIKTNEDLQISELENYLRCSRLELESLLSFKLSKSSDTVLYFIRLPKRYAVIIRSKSGKFYYHFIDKLQVDTLLSRVQRYTQGENFFENSNSNEFIETFAQLNDLLIKPIEKYLPKEGEHLTLAIDSSLQKLPWSSLYDGHKYLIEKYSLSLAIGSKLQSPKALGSNISSLVAGASQFPKNSQFVELPSVRSEISTVKAELKGKSLLNSQFTSQALLKQAENVRILHIASHGQFSSNPQQTFLLDWNGKFQLSQLNSLLRNRQDNPLDLLVLSACDTAKGDRRALLGLAGTAIQSGAKSAIASLWLVNDQSQVIFMKEFYTQLLKNKKSKAEALRLAQLKLLGSKEYSSPYYWAGIVLLGSWQ
jgi:CHAT domain-containing protein